MVEGEWAGRVTGLGDHASRSPCAPRTATAGSSSRTFSRRLWSPITGTPRSTLSATCESCSPWTTRRDARPAPQARRGTRQQRSRPSMKTRIGSATSADPKAFSLGSLRNSPERHHNECSRLNRHHDIRVADLLARASGCPLRARHPPSRRARSGRHRHDGARSRSTSTAPTSGSRRRPRTSTPPPPAPTARSTSRRSTSTGPCTGSRRTTSSRSTSITGHRGRIGRRVDRPRVPRNCLAVALRELQASQGRRPAEFLPGSGGAVTHSRRCVEAVIAG